MRPPDLRHDYYTREREKKGEDKGDGKNTRKKNKRKKKKVHFVKLRILYHRNRRKPLLNRAKTRN